MLSRPPVEGNTCNLDCLKRNPIRTFDGPVKIVLVDIPRKEYCERIWWSGLIGLSYLFIGFNAITMMMFASSWYIRNWEENIHIFFCTVGFQLLMPAGILMTTNLNGPSAPLKPEGRKLNHVVLQVIACILNLIGAILILACGPHEWPNILVTSGHCFSGMISLVLCGLTIIFGPFVFSKTTCSPAFLSLHACCGLSAYFASSISYAQSFFKDTFLAWYPLKFDASIIMATFVGIYTVVVITYPVHKLLCFDKCAQRNKPVGFK